MEREMQERFVESLIGARYRPGADGPGEFDCYGLVRHVRQHCLDDALPVIVRPVDEQPCRQAIARTLLRESERSLWQRHEQAEEWDVVLMGNVDQRPFHMGICVRLKGQFLVLHAEGAPVNRVILDDLPALTLKGFNRLEFYTRV